MKKLADAYAIFQLFFLYDYRLELIFILYEKDQWLLTKRKW